MLRTDGRFEPRDPTGSARTVDSRRLASLLWRVRFTIDRKDLINLVKRVEGRQQKNTDGKPLLRLSAPGARVFVEGVNITRGNARAASMSK